MAPELNLRNAVRALTARDASSTYFLLLTRRIIQRPLDAEIRDSLLDVSGDPPYIQRLKIQYAVAYAALSVANLGQVMGILSDLPLSTQRLLIVQLKGQYGVLNLGPEFVKELQTYSEKVVKNCEVIPPQTDLADLTEFVVWKNVLLNLVFLWIKVLTKSPKSVDATFRRAAMALLELLKRSRLNNARASLSRHAAQALQSTSLIPANDKPSLPSDLARSLRQLPQLKKFGRYLELKKVAWISLRLHHWRTLGLVDDYIRYFDLAGSAPGAAVKDVLGTLLRGVDAANCGKVAFNWHNYVITELPNVLGNLVKLGLGDSENVIVEVVQEVFTGLEASGDSTLPASAVLAKDFLRACVYSGTISAERYEAVFSGLQPAEPDHVDRLRDEFWTKTVLVNCEFTLLEESGLVEFFKALPSSLKYSRARQLQLAELLASAIDKLVGERLTDRLSRLIIALACASSVANYVAYVAGPWTILGPVIDYIDRESFTSDSGAGPQDCYEQFSTLIAGVIALQSGFGLDLGRVCPSSSFVADFISRFVQSHGTDLVADVPATSEDDHTILSNYATLVLDWILALFDPANDRGLSDDLLRLVLAKQVLPLVVVIFQQAFQAAAVGILPETGLYNGLDYLVQPFLAPSTLAVMLWLGKQVGPHCRHSDLAVGVLGKILESAGSSESNFAFRAVVGVAHRELIARLTTVANHEKLRNSTSTIEGSKTSAAAVLQLLQSLAAVIEADEFQRFTAVAAARSHYTPGRTASGVYFPLSAILSCAAIELHTAVAQYIREHAQLGAAWPRVWSAFCAIGPAATPKILEQELAKYEGGRAGEELRMVLDLVVLLAVGISPNCSAPARLPDWESHATASDHQFALSMENHRLAIFSNYADNDQDAGPDSASDRPLLASDLLMDLDMAELFDETGGGVQAAGSEDAPEPASLPVKEIYDQLRCFGLSLSATEARPFGALLALMQATMLLEKSQWL